MRIRSSSLRPRHSPFRPHDEKHARQRRETRSHRECRGRSVRFPDPPEEQTRRQCAQPDGEVVEAE